MHVILVVSHCIIISALPILKKILFTIFVTSLALWKHQVNLLALLALMMIRA